MAEVKKKKLYILLFLCALIVGTPLLYFYGRSLWVPVYFKLIGKRTVAEVVEQFGENATRRFMPHFREAGVAYPPEKLILLGLKQEQQLEVWAETEGRVTFIHSYPVQTISGRGGPKLKEGDYQVPEGFYRISGLNPNSSYHLSMKLNYPNAFDRQHAEEEEREHPGGDIFIHGKAASIGCLAMGDVSIEELFIMVEKVGRANVEVIIAPSDPRKAPLSVGAIPPAWTADLYKEITEAFNLYVRPTQLAHASALDNFFPTGTFGKDEWRENFIQEWYGKHLHSMEEPALFSRKKGVVYRFIWLRTFHNPMSFRFQAVDNGKSQLVVKKTDGHGGYEAGKITINKTVPLTQAQSGALLTLIDKQCDFWNMPSHLENDGLDGAQWILEGNKKGQYHMADRWTPTSGCMFEIGKMFMDFSGIQIENIY